MTELILTIVMFLLFIGTAVVNHYQKKSLKAQALNGMMVNREVIASMKREEELFLQSIADRVRKIVDITDETLAKIVEETQKFIDIVDSDYKIKIAELQEKYELADVQLKQYFTALKSLDPNDRKKIQYRLDRITGLKNGQERKEPITNPDKGEDK